MKILFNCEVSFWDVTRKEIKRCRLASVYQGLPSVSWPLRQCNGNCQMASIEGNVNLALNRVNLAQSISRSDRLYKTRTSWTYNFKIKEKETLTHKFSLRKQSGTRVHAEGRNSNKKDTSRIELAVINMENLGSLELFQKVFPSFIFFLCPQYCLLCTSLIFGL